MQYLSQDVFKRIFKNKSTRLRNSGPLFGMAGQMVETIGEIDISIHNTTFSARVAKYSNDNFDMIMGMDALTPLQAKIDCEGNFITLKGHKYFNKGALSQEFSQVAYTSPVSVVDELIKKHENLFSKSEGELSFTDVYTMDIDVEGAKPFKQKAYRVPLLKRQIIDDEIEKMLEMGVIEPSKSNWSSPVTLQPKKDNSTRFCIDYRKLNSVTKSEIAAIPNILRIFDCLGQATIFTILDLKAAYWQIKLTKRSREKTAFISHRGCFSFEGVFMA